MQDMCNQRFIYLSTEEMLCVKILSLPSHLFKVGAFIITNWFTFASDGTFYAVVNVYGRSLAVAMKCYYKVGERYEKTNDLSDTCHLYRI
jgi:hypothetical protein